MYYVQVNHINVQMSWTFIIMGKKKKNKKEAQNSVKGKVKMGCTTCLHPWDIQVQILKI